MLNTWIKILTDMSDKNKAAFCQAILPFPYCFARKKIPNFSRSLAPLLSGAYKNV